MISAIDLLFWKATLPLGATRPRLKAAGSLPADLSLARKKSDPAAEIESDKAASESGRFAPSGLVAGSEEESARL
ncbi:MAG: hypothetical protein COV79_03920 [Parcubacteria group bacterium CG11_big_fil_rev_8_21_14_0_20_41_14]|nr:MAG: hypothetical protein COV79_03920 [Parcubacteria group bacterium CG11_big_fil_rev_8_21_14_0_20_41_14]